jgi:hypothetical protein
MLLSLVVVSILPLLLFGGWSARRDLQSREEDFARMEIQHARTIVRSVGLVFDAQLVHLRHEARREFALASLRDDPARLHEHADALGASSNVECASVIDASGIVTYSSCEARLGLDVSAHTWFQTALRGEDAFGELTRDEASPSFGRSQVRAISRTACTRTPGSSQQRWRTPRASVVFWRA